MEGNEQLIIFTVLYDRLRPREPPVDGRHMERSLSIFTLHWWRRKSQVSYQLILFSNAFKDLASM